MLFLKFWVKTDTGRTYIECPADQDENGSYSDKQYVYIENGKIARNLIEGDIEELWLELTEVNGVDSAH